MDDTWGSKPPVLEHKAHVSAVHEVVQVKLSLRTRWGWQGCGVCVLNTMDGKGGNLAQALVFRFLFCGAVSVIHFDLDGGRW